MSSRDRLPPHNLEAEQAVLGSLLIDRDAIASVADWLKPEAFYDKRNERVYRSLLWLWGKRIPADLVTLTDQLQRVNRLDAVGGLAYLTELQNRTPTAVHLPYYAEMVTRYARQRAVIDEAAAVTALAWRDDADLDAVVGGFRRAVEPFSPPATSEGTMNAETMPLQRQEVEDRWAGVIVDHLIPTGIKPLDKVLWGGMRAEDLVVIAATSGMGKTSMMLQMAQYGAEATGKLSVIVSLEMRAKAIRDRMACATAGVPFSTVYPRPPLMSLEQLKKREHDEAALLAAYDYLAALPIAILTEQRTTDRIRGELDRLGAEHDLGMVLIDHLDHLEDDFRRENEEVRTGKLAARVKGIGQAVKVPTVLLAQLNRGVDAKAPFLPDPRHIRNSGRVRELSDILLMPYRRRAYVDLQMLDSDDNMDYLPYPRKNEQRVDLFLFKQRNGELATVPLGFEPQSMSFHDASGERRAA